MVAVAVLGVWAAYGVASWGWILVKGYNITLSEWFSPTKPYEWDSAPAMVPAGSLFPTAAGSATAAKVTTA